MSSASLFRWGAAGLIVLSAVVRVVYLGWFSPLELAPDEAHYWDWSRNLDWAYYSKGPMVALLIRLGIELFGGLSLALTGSEMLAVRMPAVICGALLSTALYVLTAKVWRRDAWAFAVVAITVVFPLFSAGASLMTIDGPFTCLWAWGLVFGFMAAIERRSWAWPAAGLCIALGLLTKPTMILFGPCFGLFLLFTPTMRPLLLRPGFWTMAVVAALGGVPILAWNAMNGWVTLHHTQGHAGVHARQSIYWLGPLVYLGTQTGLLFVYGFLAWAASLWRYRPGSESRPELNYLWWMSAPVFVFFGLFSLKNGGGEPNWPIAAYLAGLVLAIGYIAEQLASPIAWRRRTTFASLGLVAVLAATASIIVHFPTSFQPLLLTISGPATLERMTPLRRIDPTCRLRGWSTLAAAVDAERRALAARGIDPVFAGTGWTLPGEVGFHLADHPKVYCLGSALGERYSQYDIWRPNPVADPNEFKGRSFIVVGGSESFLSQAFEKVEPARVVEYREGDQIIAMWLIAVGHGYRGFPELPKNKGY